VKADNEDTSKKRKIELLNLLPAEIQAALQGNTAYDSDTDDDSRPAYNANKDEKSSLQKVHDERQGRANQSALLSLLPKAKDVESLSCASADVSGEEKEISKGKFSVPLNSDSRAQVVSSKSKIDSKTSANKFSMPLEAPLDVKGKKVLESREESNFGVSKVADVEEDDDKESVPLSALFTFAERKPVHREPNYSSTSQTYAPNEQLDTTVESSSLEGPPVATYTQEEYEQYYQAYYQYQQQILYQQQNLDVDDEGNEVGPGKKRNRRLESELLNGNIDVLKEQQCA
jgi:hypothetical protein